MNTENISLVPSFVVFQVGQRRIAFPREEVRELIASPLLFSFPHTTPLIMGVVLRRGRILPVLDLGPAILGKSSQPTRFFLVVERNSSISHERCVIPVQGACELVTGNMSPPAGADGLGIGWLDLNGEQVEVLDLQRAIGSGTAREGDRQPAAEAVS